tara:strand:+ start:2463 stop:2603 length:141 start_codon:yes stop_codon:yes gene_type:complete
MLKKDVCSWFVLHASVKKAHGNFATGQAFFLFFLGSQKFMLLHMRV